MQVESVIYMLMAQEMDRAVAFYRDVIGLNVRSQSPQWSELTFDGAVIALHGGGNSEFKETGLTIQVSDIQRACEEVVSGGGQLRSGPTDSPGAPVKLAQLSDTEGNGFTFTQHVG